jgi:hypothetical protein
MKAEALRVEFREMAPHQLLEMRTGCRGRRLRILEQVIRETAADLRISTGRDCPICYASMDQYGIGDPGEKECTNCGWRGQ